MVTGDEVKSAVQRAGITRIDHHDCSICGVMVFYCVAGDDLYFNSACGCSWSPPRPTPWEDAAEYINMQSREGKWGDVGAKVAKGFGIELAALTPSTMNNWNRELIDREPDHGQYSNPPPKPRPRRDFYWKWPVDEQTWFAWAFQNYGSKWIIWRVGPLNYRVQVAEPGQNGGWIRRVHRS